MRLTLRPKNPERPHQARASPWREPKISKAACQRAPGSPPQRTSWRSSQRWGTRRKVKRWTTNWLRQKSKKHLALLFPLLHFFWGWWCLKRRGCKIETFFLFFSFLSADYCSYRLCSWWNHPLSLLAVLREGAGGFDMLCQRFLHLMLCSTMSFLFAFIAEYHQLTCACLSVQDAVTPGS